MGTHRAQAQFDRAKWRLVLLGPFWALQLGLALAMMGLFAWRLGDTIHHYKERDHAGKTPTIELVWEVTNVVLSLATAICTFVEIVKYMAESLTPWTMLFTHVVKLTCACAILVLDVVIYVQRDDTRYSLIGLGLDAILMITAISLAIYAIRVYRRLSKYDDYSHPVNIKPYGFNDSLHRDNSYSSRRELRPSFEKRASVGSTRLSFQSASNESVFQQPMEQMSKPYSHERDTQFEDYLTRKGSVGHLADPNQTTPPWESPSDSLVVVGNANPRSRGSSVSRHISISSDHVLVAVPEEEGDVADASNHFQRGEEASLLSDDSPDRHSGYSEAVDQLIVENSVPKAGPK